MPAASPHRLAARPGCEPRPRCGSQVGGPHRSGRRRRWILPGREVEDVEGREKVAGVTAERAVVTVNGEQTLHLGTDGWTVLDGSLQHCAPLQAVEVDEDVADVRVGSGAVARQPFEERASRGRPHALVGRPVVHVLADGIGVALGDGQARIDEAVVVAAVAFGRRQDPADVDQAGDCKAGDRRPSSRGYPCFVAGSPVWRRRPCRQRLWRRRLAVRAVRGTLRRRRRAHRQPRRQAPRAECRPRLGRGTRRAVGGAPSA